MKITHSMILAIFLLWISGGQSETHFTKTGLIFNNHGTLMVSGKRLLIRSNLYLKPYRVMAKMIVDTLTKVDKMTSQLENKGKFTKVELRPLKGTITDALKMTKKHLTGFDEYIHTLRMTRQKRGLIDGAGHLFKYLFGTATNDDVSQLQKAMDAVIYQSDGVTNMVNMHSHIINETIDVVNNITQNADKIRMRMRGIHSQLIAIGEEAKDIKELVLYETYVNQILNTLHGLEFELLRLRSALLLAYEGKIDSYLLPIPTAMEALQEVMRANDVKLPFPPHAEYIAHYYKIGRILPYLESDDHFVFTTVIPLLSHPEVFELFYVDSLPVPTNSTVSIKINPQYQYLAVSSSGKAFIPLPDLEPCTQYDQQFICPPSSAIHDYASPVCEMQAFQDNPHFGLCNTVIMKTTDILLRRAFNKWLYSVSSPVNATTKCTNQETVMITLKGFGEIAVPSHCSLNVKTQFIPVMDTMIGGNFTIRQLPELSLSIFFNPTELSVIKGLDQDDELQELLPVRSLKRFKRELQQIAVNKHPLSFSPYMSNTTALLAIAISMLLLAMFCCAMCQERCFPCSPFLRSVVPMSTSATSSTTYARVPRPQVVSRTAHLRRLSKVLFGNRPESPEPLSVPMSPFHADNPIVYTTTTTRKLASDSEDADYEAMHPMRRCP